jgi:tetratricopeptide (TPR) repeat protein
MRRAAFFTILSFWAASALAQAPSVILLTLDTTRADHLGAYGAARSHTPVLDALAARGTRYARALTSAPLTLPAHCSLLTGLEPPEHGVRDNGTQSLRGDVPTLATRLAARGYATGAFVSSRVLDRRFGLARGFDVYDDRMAAERIGEYGYPERDAAAVTTAALAWTARLPAGRPFFLWVHYYDPHSPYNPPRELADLAGGDLYAGEIAWMDRQIGRLLAGLPGDPARRIVAAVGDHGEALGEHGERAHGIFLYRASLEVPLILAGPGVPAGQVVTETVATRRLGAVLLDLLKPKPARLAAEPVYSEARLPASAYGWSPLQAISEGRWRLIDAPRPELYDLAADPAEQHNLIKEKPDVANRLGRQLRKWQSAWKDQEKKVPRPAPSGEVDAVLRSLGYLSGGSAPRTGALDPKDGILLLTVFEQAKELAAEGNPKEAAVRLAALVRKSSGNVPFLTELASAQLRSGQGPAALETYKSALRENPRLDFLHLLYGRALAQLGRPDEAKAEYDLALRLNPRMAAAALGRAALETEAGRRDAAQRILRQAVDAGTDSVTILTELARLESEAGDGAAAEKDLAAATALVPGWAPAWLLWGERAEAAGDLAAAEGRYRKAAGAASQDPSAFLHLGRLLLKQSRPADARAALEQAAALAPQSAPGREARRLLAGMR